MMSVLHVCLSSFLMTCLYKHFVNVILHARLAASELRNLMCSYDGEITWSCGGMIGCKLVLLKHASFMSTV